MKRYKFDCNGHNAPAYSCSEPYNNSGYYVDADIAQELYDHLKHVVDKASDFIDNEVLNGSDDDFDQWFMSACKTLEKADKE